MPRINLNTLLLLAALGFGFYLYRKAAGALEPAITAAAETWVNLRSPPVQALGRVKLPDGSIIALADIVNAGGRVDGRGFFTWRNVGYQITGREDSIYVARRLVS